MAKSFGEKKAYFYTNRTISTGFVKKLGLGLLKLKTLLTA